MSKQAINEKVILIGSIFIAGLCSIIYELLVSTTSSYFLGDSVKQFSLTIGFYMAAMGIGSYISRFFKEGFLIKFIGIEILLGLIGGASVPLLYLVYTQTGYNGFMAFMLGLITVIGMLTGLEIPLLMMIMKKHYPLKINLSNVLSMDYMGALLATLLFPFLLLPFMGTFKTSLIFGMVNIAVGFLNLWFFSEHIQVNKRRVFYLAATVIVLFFGGMLYTSNCLLATWSDSLYKAKVIHTEETAYQNLVLTQGKKDVRLYLNGVIQFSSMDEYRYHESLVHIPMSRAIYKKNVLVLGGGEGLVAREVLKHPEVESVTIVDLDPAMFKLGKERPQVRELNENSLSAPRTKLVEMDAYVFLQENEQLYDIIIADLPDPSIEALTRLYSREFYKLAKSRLVPTGVFVTQATGTYHSNKAFWCIDSSLKAGGFAYTYPYHVYVPSFGDWGFVMAANRELLSAPLANVETKYLSSDMVDRLFLFPKDLVLDSVPANTLDQPVILELYLEDWRKWGGN